MKKIHLHIMPQKDYDMLGADFPLCMTSGVNFLCTYDEYAVTCKKCLNQMSFMAVGKKIKGAGEMKEIKHISSERYRK